MKLLSILAAALFAAGAAHAQRWEMRYFHDENDTSFSINDLAFPTPMRGVAVGEIVDARRDRARGAAVVTSDGGAQWSVVRLPATGISVFFLDDSMGWVVTPRGIYSTVEGGRSWRKLPKSPKDVLRVWFLDPQRGYAVGIGRNVHRTVNGGKSWEPLPAAAEVKSDPDYTVYNAISFAGSVGYITGWSRPPRRDRGRFPDWMEPDRAVARKEWPNMSILLGTLDGGKTWKANSSSIFGQISRVRLAQDGRFLGLIEFRYDAPYPSEVIAVDTKTGGSKRVYANKERAVTDVALAPSGPAYLAAAAVSGRLMRSPIPGRLHIMQSEDMQLWRDMEVDYRANARRAILAAPDAKNVWVATDTGMILKLVQ